MLDGVTWPLEWNVIRRNSVSNTFGMVRNYANGTPKPHQGWDFSAAVGTPAFAIADGKVIFVHNGGDYGRQLCMSFSADGKHYYAFYAHMKSISVLANQTVKKDAFLGHTGKTGNASNLAAIEDHLHFEIRTKAYCGTGLTGRVSPLKVFGVCPLHDPIQG